MMWQPMPALPRYVDLRGAYTLQLQQQVYMRYIMNVVVWLLYMLNHPYLILKK
jgi:hypothetical protein